VKNVYVEDLRDLTVDDIYQFCDGIHEENQRLEFKREIPARKIAYIACALANAEGGLIVVGVEDVKHDAPVEFAPTSPSIEPKSLLGISNSINALVNPAVPFEIRGIAGGAGGHDLVVVRVSASFGGPHEFLGKEGRRLPVRRGNATDELTLSEIAALQARRFGNTDINASKRKEQYASIQQLGTGADFFFGVQFLPATPIHMATMEKLDDDYLLEIERATRGPDDHIHEALTYTKRLTHGIYLAERDSSGPSPDSHARHRMQFDSDGDVSLRFAQREARALKDQYYGILATGYYAAQKTFRHFGATSQVNVAFRSALNALAQTEKVPQGYAEHITIDLARETFADAFTDMVLRMYRVVNITSTREAIRVDLQHYADTYFPGLDSLPDEWTSAP
jgi:hypothetical protein